MGFLGSLVKATIDTVLVPVEIVKDVATMGGALTDEKEPYTLSRSKKVIEDVEQAGDKASEGDWF